VIRRYGYNLFHLSESVDAQRHLILKREKTSQLIFTIFRNLLTHKGISS